MNIIVDQYIFGEFAFVHAPPPIFISSVLIDNIFVVINNIDQHNINKLLQTSCDNNLR
jgi:hypothetical protein